MSRANPSLGPSKIDRFSRQGTPLRQDQALTSVKNLGGHWRVPTAPREVMTCLGWGKRTASIVAATGSELTMDAPELVKIVPSPAAVVRDTVPVNDLPSFFGRAFGAAAAAAAGQGLKLVGAPFAFYPSAPNDVVEVAAGFPVSAAVEPAGAVVPMELPGGRAATIVHVGPYDSMEETYEQIRVWMAGQGLTPADHVWEVYLSDPSTAPDPSAWRTQIFWPVDD